MERAEFKKVAREGFGLKHLTDQRLDEMYDEAERNIEAYKAAHPEAWAAAEEEAAQREAK